MTTLTYTSTEGERRKLDAHALLESRREVFINRGRRALLNHLLDNGTATADDVRQLVDLPAGINPNLFGAVPGLLARANIIRLDSLRLSARPQRHAGLNRVWRLVDRDAALTWLRDHPDMPDPLPQDDPGDGLLFPMIPTNTPAQR